MTVEITNLSSSQCVIVLADYEKNEMLRSMTSKSAAKSVIFNNVDLNNSNIKLMLWNNLNDMKPLADRVEMSLKKLLILPNKVRESLTVQAIIKF